MTFPKRIEMPWRINSITPLLSCFLALCGATLDYVTTKIGLNLGFVEIHPDYQLVWAYLVYTLITITFCLTLSEKSRKIGFAFLILTSFVPAIHNILVILGFFAGIPL
jgi:hypothetical protein